MTSRQSQGSLRLLWGCWAIAMVPCYQGTPGKSHSLMRGVNILHCITSMLPLQKHEVWCGGIGGLRERGETVKQQILHM